MRDKIDKVDRILSSDREYGGQNDSCNINAQPAESQMDCERKKEYK
jgi:hypothetical protein